MPHKTKTIIENDQRFGNNLRPTVDWISILILKHVRQFHNELNDIPNEELQFVQVTRTWLSIERTQLDYRLNQTSYLVTEEVPLNSFSNLQCNGPAEND